jgi:hypothetical protein
LWSTSFGVVGASRPPGRGKVKHSARKSGNQQGHSCSARREHCWVATRINKRAAEARLLQAEQDTPPTQSSPSEFAKQRATPASEEETALPTAEVPATDERQAQLRAIASDLLYWKGGLKVLRQARLPKWRGCFQWQIEAKVEALQAEYTRLRAESATPDG